ncbi:MAG TPA: PspC domain-containing protein [Chryseosolibacter sp.]|nr:PspC domain-containing protein [Chryseosolibacter sp.]
MKKNISINISGIIFHIEEDGYENLKKYLDSINRYFSTFEDSSEILADIESRIAEIFLSKLNEEKQVITVEDVSALIATMGSVSDFKAVEEQEPESKGTGTSQSTDTASEERTYVPPKALRRDQRRKILGGVCAGLGNYFNTDPLWIRLLFAALFFAYGIPVLVYVVMWIVVPGSYELDEPEVGRKMFRDPKTRIIGGVSGGVAAFLGIDIIAVRVLFVVLTFAGLLGLFLYIILWICLPEARTITDQIQMQGEPVTLSNIESNVKKGFNIKEGEDEGILTRILLFPFRLIGMILTALGKIIDPLAGLIRVLIGVVIVLTGLAFAFGTVVAGGALLGVFAGVHVGWLADSDVPMDVFTRAFPAWTAVAGFVAALVPAIFLILLGVSTIARRVVFQAAAGWALFVLFFISIAILAVGVPRIIYSFHEDGEHRVETVYKVTGKTAVLKVNDAGGDDYDGTRLTLRGYKGPDFKLVQTFESQGSSRRQAIENAQMVDYHVDFQDSVFRFDRSVEFKEDAIFRGQHLDMILYIPYGFPFIMDEQMSRFISQYVDGEYLDDYTWRMTTDGLECINCNKEKEEGVTDIRNFNKLEISGRFNVHIVRGDNYSVELTGPERQKQLYDIRRTGQTLIIDYTRDNNFDWKEWDRRGLSLQEMQITITTPELKKIEAMGVGVIRFDDFHTDEFEIEGRGPVKIKGGIDTGDLMIKLIGKSEADLTGKAGKMNARIEFASRLDAYNLEARDAFIDVSGASKANVNVIGTLEMDEGIGSDIDFSGNPTTIRHD